MENEVRPRRVWINQPSTSQPFHRLHGTRALAVRESQNIARIYFLSGPVVSQQISTVALSEGWQS